MKPISTRSQRDYHHLQFKSDLIENYQCACATSEYIKCMIVGHGIRKDKVIASHLVALKDEEKLVLLGHSVQFKWNYKNGLLLYDSIDVAYENMEITFVMDPETHVIKLIVLFDDVLSRPVFSDFSFVEGYSSWKNEEKKRFRSRFKDFNCIHGMELKLPNMVFPSKRILLWACRSAFNYAMGETRPHECAKSYFPTEEKWDILNKYVKEASPDYGRSLYSDDVNDVFSDIE
jgi:hypothetical protein